MWKIPLVFNGLFGIIPRQESFCPPLFRISRVMTSDQEALRVHLPFREETFSSISRAVNGATKATHAKTARSHGELLRGRRIDDASCTDTTPLLRLDDGSVLEFSLGDGGVEWTLHPSRSLAHADSTPNGLDRRSVRLCGRSLTQCASRGGKWPKSVLRRPPFRCCFHWCSSFFPASSWYWSARRP